ncbi:hypothetical protein HPB47_008588, partial [Ixodes persulcatus]
EPSDDRFAASTSSVAIGLPLVPRKRPSTNSISSKLAAAETCMIYAIRRLRAASGYNCHLGLRTRRTRASSHDRANGGGGGGRLCRKRGQCPARGGGEAAVPSRRRPWVQGDAEGPRRGHDSRLDDGTRGEACVTLSSVGTLAGDLGPTACSPATDETE